MKFCNLVPLLALLVVYCPVAISFSSRIINGHRVYIKNVPYIVSIQKRVSPVATDYVHFCGGSIISKNAILTAAHCAFKDMKYAKWMFIIRAGSTYKNKRLNSYEVNKTILHPMFESDVFNYDFAIMFIKGEFKYKNTIQRICLAKPDYKLKDKEMVAVSGWGTTEYAPGGTNNLKSAEVNIINQNECEKDYKLVNEVTSAMVCAGAITPDGIVRDGCYGDSGGPLVHKGVLVGIVSWGFKCGLPDYPGVYARVSIGYEWIAKNVKTFK